MSGESTGRDISPSSSPESAGKAPMSSLEQTEPTGKFLRMPIPAYAVQNISVANSPASLYAGPESPPDQPTIDAAEMQEANVGASSQQASSSAAAASSQPETTEGSSAPKKNHLSIPIPSRRSSKADKQSTSEKTEEATQEASSRRGSKVSMLRVRRERSRASSRRSRRTQDVANADKAQETNTPSTTEMNGPSKPVKKKSSKLLSFLSCCSSSDVDGDDSALPPKKTAMRAPASNRLPTPDKAEAHGGDSSTAESRDPTYLDEKANMSVTADQSHPQEEERTAAAEAQGEGASGVLGASDIPPASSKEHEGNGAMANGVTSESKQEETLQPDEKDAATEEPPAPESTPEKAKAAENQETSHQEDVVQTQTVLPPPPPPPVPEIASDVGEQQWLLPPALPHLSNRKCLVLDLDETLVHSSFKVSQSPTPKLF
jgi:RNA polymerase II subunit A small phosphatase-like protein